MAINNLRQLKLYSNDIIFDEEGFSGTGQARFRVAEGSRIVVSFIVTDVVSGPMTAIVENTGDGENFLQVLDFSLGTTGIQQKIYSDFHKEFKVTYSGNGTFRMVVTVHDNSASTFIENANLLVDVSHVQGDSVQVGDGIEILEINTDGSINVKDVANQAANQVHENYQISIDPAVDGYAFKNIGVYSSLSSFTQLKQVYVHSESMAQVRVVIDGQEVRRKDISPADGVAEIVFKVPRNIPQADVIEIQARLAPEIDRVTTFRSALEAFIA